MRPLHAVPPRIVFLHVGQATYALNRDWAGEFLGGATPLKEDRLTMAIDGSLLAPPLGEFADMSPLSGTLGGGFGIVPLLSRIICHVDHILVFACAPRSRADELGTRW